MIQLRETATRFVIYGQAEDKYGFKVVKIFIGAYNYDDDGK